ncbi:MAG TPA: phosphatase PAP2 family protein [Candidatus Limnocylindrales bacterium]|nr:phosphatase PAP2 family protein [Candidatus Limnocylindrales bacterium]
MLWLQAHRTPGLTTVVRLVSDLGSFPIAAPLALAILLLRRWKRPRDDIVLIVVALGSAALPNVVKLLVQRARPPFDALGHLSTLSFPSEHAAQAAAIYGGIALLLSKGWPRPARIAAIGVAVVLALLVAVARVYLGVHYPTDVAGGLLLGWAWLWLIQGWAHRPLGQDLATPQPGRPAVE